MQALQGIETEIIGDCRTGGEQAATVWGLVHQGRFYYFLPTYENDELSRDSPGNLLPGQLLHWCLARNIDVFAFTAGDERHKTEWRDQTMELSITLPVHLLKDCL
jgi:CelD/BcsL family acetyltransferase involved in cellulose biosynthesis